MSGRVWLLPPTSPLAETLAGRLADEGWQVWRAADVEDGPSDAVVLLPAAGPGEGPDADAGAEALLPELRRLAAPMASRGRGRLVLVRRLPTSVGDADRALLAGAAEAAVQALVRDLARVLAPAGVTVNLVLLGAAPSGARPATPADIASLVAMLVHEEAGYLTGQCFPLVGAHS